jgi:CubicO group peptidase (beta-lactamase class C family)
MLPLPLFLAATLTAAPFNLDSTVNRAMQAFEVPGVAVAIVKDGQVVAAKGWGVRQLGAPAAVDGNTLFAVASITKAFTTQALAILVAEGKVAWDDPVAKRLPSFAWHDPEVTREMTLRDLVTHRSGLGLGQGDLLWWPQTSYSRDEIVRRLRRLDPPTEFRSGYAYENVLYIAAGQVVEAVSGKSWEAFVRERILTPLAMTSTKTNGGEVSAAANGRANARVNVATPHVIADGRLRKASWLPAVNAAPAMGIVSSANDMAKWMIALLDRPPPEVWTEQMPMPNPPLPESIAPLHPRSQAYGLGWILRDYRGHLVATHTGGLLGMSSCVLLVPDLKLGIVVLTNQESRGAFDAIAWSAADSYLGGAASDWVEAMKEVEEVPEPAAKPAVVHKPSLSAARYAGSYRDAWYGDATVAIQKGRLVLRFVHTPLLLGDLEPWDGDTFLVRWRDRTLNADALVTFSVEKKATTGMRLKPLSPQTDFSFDFQDLDFLRILTTNH